ncbi:RGCVC family protein [Actinosynnema sp. CS-041913]|uniref:RGCVC family protein n=1 Tax=Actinosynnema sp. CS-041913 TaxID=3239917 RepID=UPI003D91EBE1
MPSVQVNPQVPGAAVEERDTDKCAVCPHRLTEHDAISLRFCTATATGRHERGCVCAGSG